jgi:hypothetical protein
MEGSNVPLHRLSDEAVIYLFSEQLPELLEKRPELEPRIYHAFWKAFARKEEVAAVMQELGEFRAETRANFERVDQRFEQVDQRFEQVDQRFDDLEARMEAGFREVHQAIDRLGARWGIRNESLFRQTITELLEKSFGVQVEERHIQGEQFDCIIFDGQHILVEIAASAGRDIQQTLERKRRLYTQATGVTPARFILATASIHSQRAQALRQAGFEVIEPEE